MRNKARMMLKMFAFRIQKFLKPQNNFLKGKVKLVFFSVNQNDLGKSRLDYNKFQLFANTISITINLLILSTNWLNGKIAKLIG